MTGAELAGQVKTTWPGIAIKVATGYAELSDARTPRTATAGYRLVKRTLESIISETIERAVSRSAV